MCVMSRFVLYAFTRHCALCRFRPSSVTKHVVCPRPAHEGDEPARSPSWRAATATRGRRRRPRKLCRLAHRPSYRRRSPRAPRRSMQLLHRLRHHHQRRPHSPSCCHRQLCQRRLRRRKRSARGGPCHPINRILSNSCRTVCSKPPVTAGSNASLSSMASHCRLL